MAENKEKNPIAGASTETVLDQAHMVVPAVAEEPGEQEHDAKGGGTTMTKEYSDTETRPQELHGAVNYQKITADPGQAPKFYNYTELTGAKGTVRG